MAIPIERSKRSRIVFELAFAIVLPIIGLLVDYHAHQAPEIWTIFLTLVGLVVYIVLHSLGNADLLFNNLKSFARNYDERSGHTHKTIDEISSNYARAESVDYRISP